MIAANARFGFVRTAGVIFLLTAMLLTGCGKKETDTATDPSSESGDSASASPSSTGPTAQPDSAPSATGGTDATDPIALGVEAMTEADYRRHVETLASDEFGGRAPGSPGEELTVKYLIDHFKGLGLEPANGESYTQDVPLADLEVTNKPDLRISGDEGEDLVLTYTVDQVVWSRKQVPEVSLDDSELVFVGFGINAPERNWNDYAGIDVRGKTVVMLVNDPDFGAAEPGLFNGNAMTYYGRWTYKYDEAARQGAAGAIIIHDTLPAAYGWPTVVNSWTGKQFDLVLPDKGADLAAVEGWITRETAATLFTKAGLNLEELSEKAKQPGFTAVAMPLRVSTSLVNAVGQVNSRNVAAILKGSEAPDEVFIYMAHWDHLGTDPRLEGDQIYNGALDNASGTGALMEIAKAFAAMPQPPRRSVLFLAVTAEEQGLLGSLYYATHPLFPLASTVGGLNMDGMNNFGSTRDITVIGLGMSDLDDYLAVAAKEQERVLAGDRETEKGFYFRSDHFELAKEGVPMLYPWGGYDDREKGVAYGMEKSQEYTRDHYHRVSDEYDLSWNVSGAMEDMAMYFKTGLDVANSSDWPNWKEGSEFKAKRDEVRAGH